MESLHYDLCVIGGGINGVGIARDAAGRGLSVLLVEAGDLAGATSSASSKLIHGGLRYLEQYDFKLVHESLQEREILLRAAPHLVRPLEFVLPYAPTMGRPAWMIRAGLFLYDHLAGRESLPGCAGLDLRSHAWGAPLDEVWRKGFRYADCWGDDARLVIATAMDAAARGASILRDTACTGLNCAGDAWEVQLQSADGQAYSVRARAVVNAAGPWVRRVLEASGLAGAEDAPGVRLVKGSHIAVPRQYAGPQAYTLQQPDGRVVFAIPYEEAFTLIGTTEVEFVGDPRSARCSPEEEDYLCAAFNRSFRQPISRADILWRYSGVRPLLDDGSASARTVTRDYRLVEYRDCAAPLISVFGGKLTTYRHLGEEVVDRLMHRLGRQAPGWTAYAVLPGGDFPAGGAEAYARELAVRHPYLPEALRRRYLRTYGTRTESLLGEARSLEELGRDCGDGLYAAEVRYLMREEWARCAEDILWRRTKLGLHVGAATVRNLDETIREIEEEARR